MEPEVLGKVVDAKAAPQNETEEVNVKEIRLEDGAGFQRLAWR